VKPRCGRIKGYRPLGGSIAFGETREQALQREFVEELSTRIRLVGPWHVFENLYVHEGTRGHEIIFAAEVDLLEQSLYETDIIPFTEMNGTRCTARWIDPSHVAGLGLQLYPDGLLDVLRYQRPPG
jgi:8-oxo-dGTP pyrophosphatase MutT (NUDIX family)